MLTVRSLKGKGNPCSDVESRIEEWCGKGMSSTLSKLFASRNQSNKAKPQSKTLSNHNLPLTHGIPSPISYVGHPPNRFPDLSLLPWPAVPTLFDSQVESLRGWQMT